MTIVSALRLFFSTALALGVHTAAHAANIQLSDEKLCAFRINGPIVAGDANQLATAISGSHIDRLDERTGSVCLESNGGSYAEGLKIAELLYTNGLSTVIQFGSKCYSACAIIFMGGVSSEREIPMRKLSVGGILGFHAPYLTVPDEKYSKADVEVAAQGMRAAILSLVQFSAKRTQLSGSEFIKRSLISKILERGPKDVFFIRTIYDAARWDILLFDADQFLRKPGNIEGVKNACTNFHSSNMDEEIPQKLDLSLQLERYSSKFQKDDARILVKNAKTSDVVCELYPRTFRTDDPVKFFACSHDYWSSKSFGDCREYLTAPAIRVGNFVPPFFIYDPTLALLPFKK
jgi:hypothetical protein